MAAELTKELYASDGLALPIPSAPTVSDLAKGRDRTLVLGAGGEYYLGWYCGFFHGLYDHGLDMNAMSEMVVGTSAGSYMARRSPRATSCGCAANSSSSGTSPRSLPS